MSILQGRRRFLGFLLLVTIAVLSTSSLPTAYAQESDDVASSEAEIDASGEVLVEEVTTEDDGSAAAEAAAAARTLVATSESQVQ